MTAATDLCREPSTALPAPPVPADLDLSGLDYMPLLVTRLRRSKAWLRAKRRPEIAFYMLNLWMAAWMEKPCASLENDDDVLADAAMCPPELWDDVKGEVLAHFVLCADGRLYHEVLAEQALIALAKRQKWKVKKREQRQGAASEAGSGGRGGDKPAGGAGVPDVSEGTAGGQTGDMPLRDGTGRDEKEKKQQQDSVAARETGPPVQAAPPAAALPQVAMGVDPSPRVDPATAVIAIFDQCRAEVFGEDMRRMWPLATDLPIARQMLADAGGDTETIRGAFLAVLQRQLAQGRQPANGLGYMRDAVAEAVAEGAKPAGQRRPAAGGKPSFVGAAERERAMWSERLRAFGGSGFWAATWGMRPDEPGCEAPPDLLAAWRRERESGEAA